MKRKNRALIGKIRCGCCKEILQAEELVYVDLIFTITHQTCDHISNIIDSGPFEEVLERYPLEEDEPQLHFQWIKK